MHSILLTYIHRTHHWCSLAIWAKKVSKVLFRWYAGHILPLTHWELDVPAEPGASCAWLRPSDITHHSSIPTNLCPSLPSQQCIYQIFERRGVPQGTAPPTGPDITASARPQRLVLFCSDLIPDFSGMSEGATQIALIFDRSIWIVGIFRQIWEPFKWEQLVDTFNLSLVPQFFSLQ